MPRTITLEELVEKIDLFKKLENSRFLPRSPARDEALQELRFLANFEIVVPGEADDD